jgi:hypothetical protein
VSSLLVGFRKPIWWLTMTAMNRPLLADEVTPIHRSTTRKIAPENAAAAGGAAAGDRGVGEMRRPRKAAWQIPEKSWRALLRRMQPTTVIVKRTERIRGSMLVRSLGEAEAAGGVAGVLERMPTTVTGSPLPPIEKIAASPIRNRFPKRTTSPRSRPSIQSRGNRWRRSIRKTVVEQTTTVINADHAVAAGVEGGVAGRSRRVKPTLPLTKKGRPSQLPPAT